MNKHQPLIFTDLDGTLLDHATYDWRAARRALALAAEMHIPVIPCSSKTLAECMAIQRELQLDGPIIFENGSGIAVPKSQFAKPPSNVSSETDQHWLCGFSLSYPALRKTLQSLRKQHHFMFKGFGDMSTEEVCEHTGLAAEQAQLAQQRHYSEPLVWLDDAKTFDAFNAEIKQEGLQLTRGGRFVHVLGHSDKGKAMLWLGTLYEYQKNVTPYLIALGDSHNDLPMLQEADVAVIVRNAHKAALQYTAAQNKQRVLFTDPCGPEGWNEAVLKLLKEELVHG